MFPLKILVLVCLCLFTTVTAQSTVFQISGSVKTQEKEKSEKRYLPRGDVQTETETKVLEIALKRINPTVGASAKVQWAVWMKQVSGKLQVVTKGQREIQTSVGVPVELTSDSFELRSRDIDFRHGHGNDLEQEIAGYAIRILDEEGEEIGVKFQPSSIEEEARKLMNSASKEDDRDWSKGAFPNRPRQLRPRHLR